MQRECDSCGDPYEAKTKRSRFCGVNCRVANARTPKSDAKSDAKSETPTVPRDTHVADRLAKELMELGVFEQYEAAIVVGMAKQLDSGSVVGTAYVSLSKEVDRRVDALRLKAEKPDDPVRLILTSVEDKQAHLRAV